MSDRRMMIENMINIVDLIKCTSMVYEYLTLIFSVAQSVEPPANPSEWSIIILKAWIRHIIARTQCKKMGEIASYFSL